MNTTIKPVAIVTGAGTGIGKATAYALLKEGYNVIFVGRRLDRLDESLKSSPHPHLGSTFALDIGKPNEVLALFTFIREKFGRLDLLFNNAGQGTPAKLFDEITFDEWQAVVNVNLTGAFLCAQQAFKLMREQLPQGGRIINNGSISAHTPRPFSAPYTATKHAITGLTKSLALDGRPFGIACGQIDIGNAATEMTDRMASGIIQADGSTKPEMRMDVNHVAQAVCNMAKLPLESNVLFMTIMATNMPFVGRG